MTGTIERINPRGFGFINVVGQKDVFFHMSELSNLEFDERLQGARVEFETVESEKGPRAVNVRPAD